MKQMARTEVQSQGWPVLEPIAVEGLSRPVAISENVCVVGTRPEVNLKLSSPLVSRTHALFVADRDSIYLRDLASLNHTYVNEQPVREAVLRDGDVIGLGPLSFRCARGFDRPHDALDEVHAPAAELLAVNDGTRIRLSNRSTLIGGRDDCDVVLPGRGVEPSHAIIFELEGRRYIRDLRTVSGTWVNNNAVGQIELNDGDEIRIAQTEFAYQLIHEERPAEEAVSSPAAESPAEALDLDATEDERVELELADSTAGVIPDSIGMSDWDVSNLPDEPVPAAEDSSAGGGEVIPLASETPTTPLETNADSDVISIRLDDLSEPSEPEIDTERAQASAPTPAAHPGQHDRLADEEEPATDMFDELPEDIAELQPDPDDLWDKHPDEPPPTDRAAAARGRESSHRR